MYTTDKIMFEQTLDFVILFLLFVGGYLLFQHNITLRKNLEIVTLEKNKLQLYKKDTIKVLESMSFNLTDMKNNIDGNTRSSDDLAATASTKKIVTNTVGLVDIELPKLVDVESVDVGDIKEDDLKHITISSKSILNTLGSKMNTNTNTGSHWGNGVDHIIDTKKSLFPKRSLVPRLERPKNNSQDDATLVEIQLPTSPTLFQSTSP
jgi:hypothetical protein